MTNPFRITVTIHGPAESFRRRSGAWEGQQKEAFLVSSVAGTKAERREKEVVKSGLQARFQVDTEEKSFRSSP